MKLLQLLLITVILSGCFVDDVDSRRDNNIFHKFLNFLQLSSAFHGNTGNNNTIDLGRALEDLKSLQFITEGNLGKLVRSLNNGSSHGQDVYTTTQSVVSNVPSAVKQTISIDCRTHLTLLWESLLSRENWAMRMLDAAGKLPSGLLDGNFYWVGSFDECRRIKNVKAKGHPGVSSFDAKMCYVDIPLQKLLESIFGSYPVSIHFGVCVPDSCSANDVLLLSNMIMEKIPLTQKLRIIASECQENHLELDNLSIAGICVCGFFAVLLICGTLYDAYLIIEKKKKKNGHLKCESNNGTELTPGHDTNASENNKFNGDQIPTTPGLLGRVLLSFSMYSNSKKIMSTRQTGGALGAINGIRFLSMSWVILGHTYLTISIFSENISYFLPHTLRRWSDLAIVDALVSVDSFFAISGLLLSYLFLKEMKRCDGATKTNWFLFYFHRFWRLSPPYWLVLFVNVSLYRYIGNGPIWNQDGIEKEQCHKNWWTNLLYINNFVKHDDMCISWSWYLADDMQFYILSPLMLVPLYYSKIAGSVMCFLFLLASTITTGVISRTNELSPSIYSLHPAGSINYFDVYYDKPYCRIGPYVIGLYTGYLLYRWKGKCNVNKFLNLVCWALTVMCACLVVYGLHNYIKGGDMSAEVIALYNATHRSLWGACVCWIVFSCVTGHGGFVNTILSWKGFIPLGRLSYCAYLVHPLVLGVNQGTLRSPKYLNDLNLIQLFLSNLVASYVVAFVTSLAFESPMMSLEKVIFRRGDKK